MIGANEHVKFIDFGVAIVRNHEDISEMDVYGTPAFIAPEVLTGHYG